MGFSQKNFSQGMSLVEMLIALSITTILAFGSGALIQSLAQSHQFAERKKEFLTTVTELQNSLKISALQSPENCKDFIKILGGGFAPAGKTPVEIVVSSGTYSSGSLVQSTGPKFRIDEVYFDDKNLVSSLPAGRIYVANLLIRSSIQKNGIWLRLPTKTITNTTVRVDGAGQILECSVLSLEDAQQACESIEGFVWDSQSQRCVMQPELDSDANLFTCSPGFQLDQNNVCTPVPSACSYNQLPTSFSGGIVDGCISVPIAKTIQYPVNYTPPNAPPIQSSTGPTPTPPPPTTCLCNQWTIPVGSTSEYCGTSRKVSGGTLGSSFDLDGDLQITVWSCNTNGDLQQLHNYYEEESSYRWSGMKPLYCNSTGRACRKKSSVP